jgi:hypothetical protein
MAQSTPFYISQILGWADAFYERTGRWPNLYSGTIWTQRADNWRRVDSALRLGLRGLPGGSSLARLLAEERGVRNSSCLPRLSQKQIVEWAEAHCRRTGQWPKETSGPVLEAPEESWHAIDRALRAAVRGLPGNTSLAQLLAQRRGVRNIQSLPHLTVKQILAWADAYYRRHGTWPTSQSGAIDKAPGETWSGVNAALQSGRRSFPGGFSLARLLARHRGVRNPKQPPQLSEQRILRWAGSYFRRTGNWPDRNSGPVVQAPGETWAMIDRALRKRQRGLRGKSSLFRLLLKHGKIGGRSANSQG